MERWKAKCGAFMDLAKLKNVQRVRRGALVFAVMITSCVTPTMSGSLIFSR